MSSDADLAVAYPTQREAAELLGIDPATLSRRIVSEDLEVIATGAREKRVPTHTILALNERFRRRSASAVATGLVEIARKRAPLLAIRVAEEARKALSGSVASQPPTLDPHPSGRAYIRTYAAVRRAEHHDFVERAIVDSGATVLYRSPDSVAPGYFAIEEPDGRRTGLVTYVFMATRRATRNRPKDESRLQIRYGDVNDPAWRLARHPVAFDPAGVDLTVVLGAAPEQNLLVALDPLLYDPLPLGISVFWKDEEVAEAQARGWHSWERDNAAGVRRGLRRAEGGVETLIAFAPKRMLDYLRLEREAQALALDPALRLAAAQRQIRRRRKASSGVSMHDLEREYSLPADVILDLIRDRGRVAMAVRGGVAEHHLGEVLSCDPNVVNLVPGQQEGPPDYFVTLRDGLVVSVECKNASPKIPKRDPVPRVEVQKTRVSRSDPVSRLYKIDAFQVLAACMYGPTGEWRFQFRRTVELERSQDYPDRLHYKQRIEGFYDTLSEALRL